MERASTESMPYQCFIAQNNAFGDTKMNILPLHGTADEGLADVICLCEFEKKLKMETEKNFFWGDSAR